MISKFEPLDSATIGIHPGFSVFCDMDGTLVDTDYANYLSYRRAVIEVTRGMHDIDFTDERLNRENLKKRLPSLTATQLEIIAALKAQYFTDFISETILNTALAHLITKHQGKNTIILVTHCRKRRALEVLKHHKLLECFSQLICHEDLLQGGSKNKYECAIELTGASHQALLVFENDKGSIEEAVAAGVPRRNIHRIVASRGTSKSQIPSCPRNWEPSENNDLNIRSRGHHGFFESRVDHNVMNQFIINSNSFLSKPTTAFFHVPYTRMGNPGNPDYLNDLKNTFNNFSEIKLRSAALELQNALQEDLPHISRSLRAKPIVVCVVPRAKAENAYRRNQQLFRATVQEVIRLDHNFIDGTSYLCRHTNTKTTHLRNPVSNYINDGPEPYPGITEQTCDISTEIAGKNILLIDDIYTPSVNIDEDAINALLNAGARTVTFYAIGKVQRY